MELLRNLRSSTRLLFLYEVTTNRHTRLRTIAERLGMTVQGASEYAHGLQGDGLLVLANGEYRATKKGVELLHDGFLELRRFVERAGPPWRLWRRRRPSRETRLAAVTASAFSWRAVSSSHTQAGRRRRWASPSTMPSEAI